MERPKRKGAGGRPPTGRHYPHKVFGYFDDEGLRLLNALAQKGNGKPRGTAEVLRIAVKRLAKAEGVE